MNGVDEVDGVDGVDGVGQSGSNQRASAEGGVAAKPDAFLVEGKRFQFSRKIINAFESEMGFDGRVNRFGDNLSALPACQDGGFGALIVSENQHGADL
jgi:hypothetical protein